MGSPLALSGRRDDWEPPAWSRLRATTPDARRRRNAATVLVVHDNEAVRTSVGEVLRFVGYTVIESGDGIDALWLLRAMRFDAVVVDLSVPGRDGISVLAGLPTPPPVVVLSARQRDPIAWARVRRSVVTHLRKPVAPQELIESVASAIGRPLPPT